MNIVLRPVMPHRLDMLYIPERVSTKAIGAALQAEVARRMVTLSVGPRLSVSQRVEFSQHGMDWTDRLIVGDSRIIMNSVLGCDLMVGKVQMIYLDPPDSAGDDESPPREADPSLAYLRDRLILCRGLLHDSGGVFVRISDEDRPGVRSVMDAVFGSDNYCGIVTLGEEPLSSRKPVADDLIWYSRDLSTVSYRQLVVLMHFRAQYPTVFGEGRERRKRCGILLG